MCSSVRAAPAPAPAPVVDNSALIKQQEDNNRRLDEMEKSAAAQRAADAARAEKQFAEAQATQKSQFEQSLTAQDRALQLQLKAQEDAQKRAEETNLKGQVPQMTTNDKNARRVQPQTSTRAAARRAAQGTSQLRVPLSIQGMSANSGSPVKLNIGS
jgi:hypothetical protein